ncbi:DUF3367 domain-containing protein [Actinomadura barringtoniae]|uniref:DUF3367 domain-containing protein n=1 Tax=Actinomadura barringtoniae TaxID=1427535 RepID=A0A939PEP0_9ACTN|nr:DUF3367 domain-containing protein [Actinomadura barringtoniae]
MAVGETDRHRSDQPPAIEWRTGEPQPAEPPPPERPEPAEPDPIDPRLQDRLRALVCCLALAVLAFGTRPGKILADTKIDMAVNPDGFLGRALHLWDPEQFGQLQNQAVGYLFPVGPFHALGNLIGMPPWITQRLWLTLLMCLAFLGTRRLAERLGIGGPVTRLVGGLAYALAPSGLSLLGQISSEYLPLAMLPWIVLPLITAIEGGGRVRAAARSGLAIACCGGINATATVAVLVVPFIYLVTRPRRAPRIRLLGWWSLAAGAATAWWLLPLLLTGTYGFSWLTYTEKAETTTGPTGLINTFRGAERWVNYLLVDGQVWWPVGHDLSLSPFAMMCTGLLAALGLAGLLRRLLPERTFLLLTLLAGLVIISAGHLSDIPGPFAAQTRDLLDGPLAPLRNLHKFDAVVRLPLALGLTHLLVTAPRPWRAPKPWTGARAGSRTLARSLISLQAVAFAALAGITAPALSSGLSGPGDFAQVPKYWRDAASWLNAQAGEQGVLALPGASFGEYLWGRPMDDIVQPLLSARWGVRQLVPAGSPGYTRALDAIDLQVRSGRSSPGLAEFLGRMGMRYVLVRNDLSRETLRGAWPARLHQSLDASPGLKKVATFGGEQPVGGALSDDTVSAVDQKYPPLEVYEVEGADDVASLSDATNPLRVYGGPESLLTMADDKALNGRPALVNDDAPDLGGSPVVSDSQRSLTRNFGELHQTSQTLSIGQSGEADDVLDDGWNRYATTAAYTGIKDVTASTSAAGADAIPQARKTGATPYAALDGNPVTSWLTGGWNGPEGQWLRVDLQQPTDPKKLTAAFVDNKDIGPPVGRVEVQTERGAITQNVKPGTAAQPLQAPAGPTRWLRIRIVSMASQVAVPAFTRAGIADLAIGGVKPGRTFMLPDPGRKDATYVLSRAQGDASECMKGSDRWVCDPSLGSTDEEGDGFDRTFTSAAQGRAAISGTTVLTDPRLIAQYTAAGKGGPVVAASSTLSTHPADQARSAFDGDPKTTWIAGDKDNNPSYTVLWGKTTKVSTVTVKRPPGASGPLRMRVEGVRGDVREGLAGADGKLVFAPLDTDRLTVTFARGGSLQPIQVTDLVVPGVKPLPDNRDFPFKLTCGFGPRLKVGGATVNTSVSGTMGDLLEGRPLRFTACGKTPLKAGQNHLSAMPFDPYRIDSAVVGNTAGPDDGPQPVQIRKWSAGSREVAVDAAKRSFLTVNENFNTGWKATVGGNELRPVRLDGWKQGWVVPAGTNGVVKLTYTPDRAQRIVVVAGLNLLLVLLLVVLIPMRNGRERRPLPLVAGTGWPVWAAVGLAAVTGLWVAGIPGVAVTGAAAVLFAWARTRTSRALRFLASPWLIAGVMIAGTGCLAVGVRFDLLDNPAAPSGLLGDVVPQLLALVIVARLVIELWRPKGRKVKNGGGTNGDGPGHGPDQPVPTGGRIRISWAAPDDAASAPGEPAAGTGVPPGSGSPSPVRWSPPPAPGDRSADRR